MVEFEKHPDDRMDVDITVISNDSDTVSGIPAVAVSPSGLTYDAGTYSGATAKLWFLGGSDDADYVITARLTTAVGRIINKVFTVKVRAS